MKVIIDRFEGGIAVAELPSGEMVNVPRVLFENAREGDHVEITVVGKPFQRVLDDEEFSKTPEKTTAELPTEAEESGKAFDSAQETEEITADENPAEIFKRLRRKSKKRR